MSTMSQGSTVSPDEVLSLAIEPVLERVPLMPLYDWVQRDAAYRDRLRPADPAVAAAQPAAAVLVGDFDPPRAVGLLRLVRTWLELQRARANVHVSAGGGTATIELDGQFLPDTAAARLLAQAAEEARAATD
jgi:Effector Associated Constant Component 1